MGKSFMSLFAVVCAVNVKAQVVGYYEKTWAPSAPVKGANIGVAFSGWANASLALNDSSKVFRNLTGDRYITVGGGNGNGSHSTTLLTDLTTQIQKGHFSGYAGIVFDIEECSEEGLASTFESAFAAAKAQKMTVVVTVSHAAPYGCFDAQGLMRAFIISSNVDMLSPQLYISGVEKEPDFEDGGKGITWADYSHARGKFVPSIGNSDQYAKIQKYFKGGFNITTAGYFQWASAGQGPTPPPAPSAAHGVWPVREGDTCSVISDRLCNDGANWAKTICDSNKVCSNLRIGEVLQYDCSGTGKFCDNPSVEFLI